MARQVVKAFQASEEFAERKANYARETFITSQEVCYQKVAGHLPELDLSFLDEEDGEAAEDQP